MSAADRPRRRLAGLALLVLLVLILLAGGCASRLPVPEVVRIPTPVPCLAADQLPARPALEPDAVLRLLPAGDLVLALARERAALAAYSAQAAPLLEGCVGR